MEKFNRSPPKDLIAFTQGDDAFHPPEGGLGIVLLEFDIDGLVMILGVNDYREIQFLRIAIGEAGIAI